MKFGLIGKTLGHSWSAYIHHELAGIPYELKELAEEQLPTFLQERDFCGINVTIPYKEAVIPYLDELDDTARSIGAVNCIINDNGRLIGHNTDLFGFTKMVEESGIDVRCPVAILGSGGAAKAASLGITQMGGKPIIVSRHPQGDEISYEELYDRGYEVIVNATPIGMAPDVAACPIDLDKLSGVRGIIDIVANPLVTTLMFEAKCRGIAYCGGFAMLVWQAVGADALFTGNMPDVQTVSRARARILRQKRNIVLIGMPSGGKTTVGRMTSDLTGMPFVDMDEELEKKMGMSVRGCFDKNGEAWFRSVEHDLAVELSHREGTIISCGGGIIKDKANMEVLQHNGLIVWIDRSPDLLVPTASRPLSSSRGQMKVLYEERHAFYDMYKDVKVDNNGGLGAACRALAMIVEGKA